MGMLMFEHSLVESSGDLRSEASKWMGLAATFNFSLLALLMVKPLLYPEALPSTALVATLSAPPPLPAAPPRAVKPAEPVRARVELDPFTAPTRIPDRMDTNHEDPPPGAVVPGAATMSSVGSSDMSSAGAIGLGTPPALVTVAVKAPQKPVPAHISSGVIAGNKLTGSTPVYPPIAKAAHVSGAVVLHAVISRAGSIQSLSVVSGPEMLRANAVAAVQDWRYRPYLLNGEPTDVDTTITVNFSFGW